MAADRRPQTADRSPYRRPRGEVVVAQDLAGLFGIQAALLLHGTSHVTRLQKAVDRRDLIGQAEGVLMERFDVDDEAAFPMLVRSSQEADMKLTAVADRATTNRGSRARPGIDPRT